MLHLVGWSTAEIAAELGYGGVATVASTLSRIKRDARARAGEYGWGLPSGLRQTG